MPSACMVCSPAATPSRMENASGKVRSRRASTRSMVGPSTSSITRTGLGRARASKVTNPARLECDGRVSSAPASSRNRRRNSSSDSMRATEPSYDGIFSANRSAPGSWRSSARQTTNTEPAVPRPIGRCT